jgi:hypothetical protein
VRRGEKGMGKGRDGRMDIGNERQGKEGGTREINCAKIAHVEGWNEGTKKRKNARGLVSYL